MKRGNERKVYYLLPLEWSLHYIMSNKEWQDFRQRVKKLNPEWDKCSCPKRCKANALDEQWDYDNERHIKRFKEAEFICQGCHWLKTPSFRLKTWKQQEEGSLPSLTKTPHIIDCLGWSEAKVNELREHDLARDVQQKQKSKKIYEEVMLGIALMRPWAVDLSAMSQYGYSLEEIADYNKRMQGAAEERFAKVELTLSILGEYI